MSNLRQNIGLTLLTQVNSGDPCYNHYAVQQRLRQSQARWWEANDMSNTKENQRKPMKTHENQRKPMKIKENQRKPRKHQWKPMIKKISCQYQDTPNKDSDLERKELLL